MVRCKSKNFHEKIPNGSKRIHSAGYTMIKVNGEWLYEHRIIMESIIGRPLSPKECIHHKNEIKSDNRPENLELFESMGAHHRKRHSGPPITFTCKYCGEVRQTKSGYNLSGKGPQPKFCNRECLYAFKRGKPFSGIQGHPKGGYNRDHKSKS